jgi:hypothetical protein
MVKVVISNIPNEDKKPSLWKTIGTKYMIHIGLLNKNKFLIKYQTYSPIPFSKQREISSEFKNLWLDILDTGTINYDLLKKSSYDERQLFKKIVSKGHININFEESKMNFNNDELIEQFKIIQGQIIAGNNNKNLLIELKELIPQLIKINKLSIKDANDIFEELELEKI